MSRRRSAQKRIITEDVKYQDRFVAKLINIVMQKGKKSTAQGIVYEAFEKIEKESGRSPVEVYKEAVEHVRPLVQVRSRRVGGATYPVPMEVKLDRSQSLALRWIVKAVRKRIARKASDSLAKVLLDSVKGVGDAMEERKKVHAMAEANKAFIHFRW